MGPETLRLTRLTNDRPQSERRSASFLFTAWAAIFTGTHHRSILTPCFFLTLTSWQNSLPWCFPTLPSDRTTSPPDRKTHNLVWIFCYKTFNVNLQYNVNFTVDCSQGLHLPWLLIDETNLICQQSSKSCEQSTVKFSFLGDSDLRWINYYCRLDWEDILVCTQDAG